MGSNCTTLGESRTNGKDIRCLLIGTNLSKPHTSGKFGIVIMYTINYKKKRTVDTPCLVGMIVCVTENNEITKLIVY